MSVPTPHFLLFSTAEMETEASPAGDGSARSRQVSGRWRFLLESVDGSTKLEVADRETEMGGQRLELLAVIRGLEALDQPSRVTLVTSSDYVQRGLRFGVPQWRDNDWLWESFGQMVPVRNVDLWQRLDRATRIHEVQCRTFRFDTSHGNGAEHARPSKTRRRRAARPKTRRRAWSERMVHFFRRVVRRPDDRLQPRAGVPELCTE
jgi:ribonuclease HI